MSWVVRKGARHLSIVLFVNLDPCWDENEGSFEVIEEDAGLHYDAGGFLDPDGPDI